MKKTTINIPTMKELAKKGWATTRCYTSSPQCVPARLSWLTGINPSALGVTKNLSVDLKETAPTFAQILRKKGLINALIGKTHWTTHSKKRDLRGNIKLMNKLGFDHVIEIAGPRALRVVECEITDEWKRAGCYEQYITDLKKRYGNGKTEAAWTVRETILPNELYPDIWIKDKSIEILKKLIAQEKPWCLWISFVGPHEPFDTPYPWKGNNKKKKLPTKVMKENWIDSQNGDSMIKIIKESWRDKLFNKKIRELREDYADRIELIDEQIGDIYKLIKAKKIETNTAIVITSDHGEMLGDGDMLYKSTFLESSINVPYIYKPIGKGNAKIGNKGSNKPIGVTELLRKTIETYAMENSIQTLKKWLTRQNGAVVEYGEERAFIMKSLKVVLNKKGDIIWATKSNREQDRRNYAEIANREEGEWKKIVNWARKVNRKRNRKSLEQAHYIEFRPK